MSYAIIDAALPEDIADRIARDVHKSNFEPVGEHIKHNVMSYFDHAIEEGTHIPEYIHNAVANALHIEDDYTDWHTSMFIFLDTCEFALYHHYHDGTDIEKMLIDGSYTKKSIILDRYYHIDNANNILTTCDDVINQLAFDSLLVNTHCSALTFDMSRVGRKKWKHPKHIIEALS